MLFLGGGRLLMDEVPLYTAHLAVARVDEAVLLPPPRRQVEHEPAERARDSSVVNTRRRPVRKARV
jgi:hypothetical protein